MLKFLESAPVVPLITQAGADGVLAVVAALQDQGIRCCEIDITTGAGIDPVVQVRRTFPEMTVGAAGVAENSRL